MKQPLSLRARAMAILSRRETSRLELQRKLAPYAENEQELTQVLSEFSERDWQSDERFTETFIRSKSQKHGRLRLKNDLAAKGIARELINAYLPDDEDERHQAIEIVRKKFKHAPQTSQDKQKQMRFLAYRGFTADIAHAAIHEAWLENDSV